MINISYNFEFFMKLIFFLFIPIVVVVLIGSFLMKRYSSKIEDKNTPFYHYTMEYLASLLAMVLVGILLAVVTGFSISFTSTMKAKDLIVGNEAIYYILMLIPIVPLTFLLYYIRKFIVASKGRKENYHSATKMQHN